MDYAGHRLGPGESGEVSTEVIQNVTSTILNDARPAALHSISGPIEIPVVSTGRNFPCENACNWRLVAENRQ